MGFNRKEFLKLSGSGIFTLLTGGVLLPERDPRTSEAPAQDGVAMLYDATKCIGCKACQVACKQWNNLAPESTDPQGIYESPRDLSGRTYTLIKVSEVEEDGNWAFVKRNCMHCLHPACVSACPVSALQKRAYGPVVYDPKRCIGCRYCMMACPFGVPRFEWEKPLPLIQKCTLCFDRLAQGLQPACVEACPTGANIFGEREALIAEAESRIKNNPDKYVNHVYGKEEVGGTSVLHLSPIPFEEVGLPTLDPEPVPALSEKAAIYGTTSTLIGVAGLLGGIYWLTKRRTEGMQKQGEEA